MIFQISAIDFQGALNTLNQLGLSDFILPFILIFTLLFAVLDKIKIFKEKKYNSLIALAIALLVVIPHALGQYPPGGDVIQIINSALPGVAMWIVIIISFLILIGIFAPGNIRLFSTEYGTWITVGAVVVVGYIFGSSAGWWSLPNQLNFLANSQTQALIIIIAVFVAIIGWITGEGETAVQRAQRANIRQRQLEEAEMSREELATLRAQERAEARGHH